MLITPEQQHRLSALQGQVWQSVSIKVSESVGQGLSFIGPESKVARISEVFAEFTTPMMVVQFAFAQAAENYQLMMLPRDTVESLVESVTGAPAEDLEENAAADLRALLEGVVQGICMAVGQIRNETVVATGLSIRYQIPSLPPNLQRSEELNRCAATIEGDVKVGNVIWLLDAETAQIVIGGNQAEEDPVIAFPNLAGHGLGERTFNPVEDQGGLELLMDIPLNISVELGRVNMLVKEVVELGAGSIVELDKAAGEPVDVLVNGRLVARGEVVVIEDNFGVRVTEIMNPTERLGRIGEAA